MKILFWTLFFGSFYSYFGYPLFLWLLIQIKRLFQKNKQTPSIPTHVPDVTLIIPAYNEKEIVDEKMQNTLALNYPMERLHIIWITDGSTDGTNESIQSQYGNQLQTPKVTVLHQPERRGKSAALNRAVSFATTEIIISCDANTMLYKDAIWKTIRHFENPRVGGVAGEKRVIATNSTVGAGESLYWKYESWIKKLNSDFYTCIGAVGEFNAFRKQLYEPLPEDTLIDDFVISMRIAEKGYQIVYEPDAYAEELPSQNEKEEMKRKIRIAAGDFQTLFRYPQWLNPFKNPLLAFQYLSYKVTRWVFVPLALPLLLFLNGWLLWKEPQNLLWQFFGASQLLFYLTVLLYPLSGGRSRLLRIPYYFFLMNLSMYLGFLRYLKGTQSAAWEKAKREKSPSISHS